MSQIYSFRIFSKIKDIRDIWIDFQKSNHRMSPFQYFFYNLCIEKQIQRLEFLFKKIHYIVLYRSDKPVIIAPVVISRRSHKVELLQHISGCGCCDLIYGQECDFESMKTMIHKLSELSNGNIRYDALPEYSLTLQTLNQLYSSSKKEVNTSVDINLHNDYDSYFKSLSKNARQNIRTAYNRLAKDQKEISFECSLSSGTEDAMQELTDVYYNRRTTKYGNGGGLRQRFSSKLASHLKHDSISLKKADNRFYAFIRINGSVAAMLMGFSNLDQNSISVPRLAIDPEFGFYSPGIILLNETIRFLIENSNFRRLDLTKGTEKYKFQMGGYRVLYLHRYSRNRILKESCIMTLQP